MEGSDAVGSFEELVGQNHLFGKNKPLYLFYHSPDKPPSLILYGPPGVGKTTYARLLAEKHEFEFFHLNATDCSSSELRDVLKKGSQENPILLVIDEIHRFDKRQQDILLPYLENGSVVLVGTSTFNPYFKLTKALRSRCFVYEFKRLTDGDLFKIGKKVMPQLDDKTLSRIVVFAGGDARRLINMINVLKNMDEIPYDVSALFGVDLGYANETERYDLVSAFIKSMRGSDVDAALYYLARLLEAGEDPEFIARRMCIFASEDIGLADNNAINVASSVLNIVKEIGMPEAKITLAHCCVYLSKAKKSNSAYAAIKRAIADIKNGNIMEIPVYLTPKGRSRYLNPHRDKEAYRQKYLSKDVKYFFEGENDQL